MAIDPVCKMEVEEDDSESLEFQGRIFYFCSPVCKEEFQRDPERYANLAA